MNSREPSGFSRRGFIVAGSAGLLGSVALASGPHAVRRFEATSGPGRAIDAGSAAIGYWRGSEQFADLGTPIPILDSGEPRLQAGTGDSFEPDVVAADALPTGDARFVETGALLTVHGLFRTPGSIFRSPLESLSADLQYDVMIDGRRETLACSTWSYQRSPHNVGAPITQLVPVDAGLRLAIHKQDGALGPIGRVYESLLFGRQASADAATGSVALAELTPGSASGRPKLRRGFYFIAAPDRRAGRQPAWKRFRFESSEAGDRCLVESGLDGPRAVDFDYLVVSVEPAPPATSLV